MTDRARLMLGRYIQKEIEEWIWNDWRTVPELREAIVRVVVNLNREIRPRPHSPLGPKWLRFDG